MYISTDLRYDLHTIDFIVECEKFNLKLFVFQMDSYRFSISWARVLPKGDIANVNEEGIEYYNKLIDSLLEHNIEPMVTMYHYDLPLRLQQIGGFSNALIVDYFEAYAKLLFERFGNRVRYWITFNEPYIICRSYGNDIAVISEISFRKII